MDMHWHFTELSELTPLGSDIISCTSTSTDSDDNVNSGIDSVLVFPDLALPEEICTEVIGCRKKGRRKGCKNKTPEQRKANKELSRELKNCKERKRVNNIRTQYERLRIALGDNPQHKKKFRKQVILNAAIEYIHSLENVLANGDESNEGSSTCTTTNKPEKTQLLCNEIFEESLSSSSNCSELSSPSFLPKVSPTSTFGDIESLELTTPHLTNMSLLASPTGATATGMVSPPLYHHQHHFVAPPSLVLPPQEYFNLFGSPPPLSMELYHSPPPRLHHVS